MIRRVPYAIIMLLVLSACSKEQEGEVYFPKASNGTSWEYTLRYTTPSGVHMGRMVISIDRKETIKGKKYYKQITLISGIPGSEPHVSYNRRTKEGIYKIDESNSDRPEYLVTPFPVRVGNIWTAQTSDGQTRYKAEKIETVEMNNKKFENCLKISFQSEKGSQKIEGFSYFAPRIGEVYSLINMGDVKVDYALDKYKLE